jgi:hypothetical protein
VLTDAQWAKMEPHCLGKLIDPGRSGSDNRRFVEAVLWIARSLHRAVQRQGEQADPASCPSAAACIWRCRMEH